MVFINRSFYPDIEATGQFYTELADFLSDKFDITFICGLSYYLKIKGKGFGFWKKEKFKNMHIIRIRHSLFWKGNLLGRFINWVTFSFLSFFILLRLKYEILICGTDPPLLGILCYIIKKLKNVKYIYGCNDLYPDVAIALGTFKKGIITKSFDYFNKKALKNSLKVVVLGRDMAELVKNKGLRFSKIEIIPNWVDTMKIMPIEKENNLFIKKNRLMDKFIIMHSGNMGLPQNLEILIDSLGNLEKVQNWIMVFIGDGAKKKEIIQRVKQKGLKEKVLFLPYQPRDFLSHSLSAADLHIVSLKKGAKGVCVPSKVYGILSAGRPFISICDEDSNSSIIAKKYKCGIHADPEDINDISNKIKWAIKNKEELKKMGKNARKVALEKFDKNIIFKKWKNLLEEVILD